MNMSSTFETLTFTVPLSFEAHEIAEEFYQTIQNPQKAKQVYLNTLAVYAVDYYLQCMGLETDWQHGDSRNPMMFRFMDVADLVVRQVGKLECRPVLADADVCEIPPEVWENRVGYVAVRLNDSLKEATILGFTRTPVAEVPLDELRSLEDFLIYLYQIRQPEPIRLGQWLGGIIEEGWLAIEELLNPPQLAYAFRRQAAEVKQGQRIDLDRGESVALIISLRQDEEGFNLLAQLYPINNTYLPEGVQLIAADDAGNQLQAQSRTTDNLIQLEFDTVSGEKFNITITSGETSVTKEFVI